MSPWFQRSQIIKLAMYVHVCVLFTTNIFVFELLKELSAHGYTGFSLREKTTPQTQFFFESLDSRVANFQTLV